MPRAKRKKRDEAEPEPLDAVPVTVVASLCGIPLELKLLVIQFFALEPESKKNLSILCQLCREFDAIAAPLLYEELIVSSAARLRTLSEVVTSGRRPSSFFKRTVKSICLRTSMFEFEKPDLPHLDALLTACCDITTFAVRYFSYSLSAILARHCTKLKRLLIPDKSFLDSKKTAVVSPRMLTVFSKNQISHLQIEIPMYTRLPECKIDLTSLSSLTHLLVNSNTFFGQNNCVEKLQNVMQQTLALPQSLEVCVMPAYASFSPRISPPMFQQSITAAYDRHPILVIMAIDQSRPEVTGEEGDVSWYIQDLVPIIENDLRFLQTWTSRRDGMVRGIWELAEGLITSRKRT